VSRSNSAAIVDRLSVSLPDHITGLPPGRPLYSVIVSMTSNFACPLGRTCSAEDRLDTPTSMLQLYIYLLRRKFQKRLPPMNSELVVSGHRSATHRS